LWLVKRDLSFEYNNYTMCFEVCKLEFDAQSGKIKQMLKLESLGDNVLFVGENDSIFASTSYFSGCLKEDSIYYADNCFTNDTYAYKLNCATPCQFDIETYKVKGHHMILLFGFHHIFNGISEYSFHFFLSVV
jgi:hypothetical protein